MPNRSGRAIAHEVAVMAEQLTGRGPRGVVAAAAPQAARAGAGALDAGGNAFDAAVTAALAETVVLPPKCGLGGDLIALVLPGGADRPEALIAVGGAPAGLAGVARSGAWRDVGATAVGPPAAAAGYAALAARANFGRARLAAPARRLATDGFAWATVCTRLAEQAAPLVREMHPEGCVYYPGGEPIAPGTLVRLPGLDAALAEWEARGEHFLDGPVGEAIVDAVAARGGVLRTADLAAVRAEWMTCASAVVGDRTVWATPAPTHGPSLLDALRSLAQPASATPADTFAAVLAAIGRRRDVLADPSGTSMVSAADAEGNVVVIVHSNSFPRFGSGIVEPRYSLTLANRAGRGFTPRDGHPNFPVAGRRPATTLHAWAIAGDDGRPRLLGGTPGGANQMPWNAQSLVRVLAGEERPGVLVASPLWEWLPDDDGVRIERGLAADQAAALAAAAPRTVDAPRWGCKSAQQVVRVPRGDEVWEAAADPRTVGSALGV